MPKLKVVTQPGTEEGIEFYKDEGGKSNWIRIQVAQDSGRTQDVKLETKLYFESGLVCSEQEILVVRGGGGCELALNANQKRCEIEFRINKVSRRKDNQRFLVKILAVSRGSSSSSSLPDACFTRPITVLSKRKIPARLRNDPEAIARFKAAKAAAALSSKKAALLSSKKRGDACSHKHDAKKRHYGTRCTSEDCTPEMRPLTASKKRQRTEDGKWKEVESSLRLKIDHMSRTIDKLYDIMTDQRVQISRLQEQVRVLADNQEPMFGDLIQPPSGALQANVNVTGLDVMNGSYGPMSPIKYKTVSDSSSSSSSSSADSAGLSISSSPSQYTFNDKAPVQWAFGGLEELPMLNI